jgi:hypothetical protein
MEPTTNTTSETEAEVLAVHDQFWQSYARRDLDARFAVTFTGASAFFAQYFTSREVVHCPSA